MVAHATDEAAMNKAPMSQPHPQIHLILSEVARRGGSPASLRLAAQLFAPPCPKCDYVIHRCRCKENVACP